MILPKFNLNIFLVETLLLLSFSLSLYFPPEVLPIDNIWLLEFLTLLYQISHYPQLFYNNNLSLIQNESATKDVLKPLMKGEKPERNQRVITTTGYFGSPYCQLCLNME